MSVDYIIFMRHYRLYCKTDLMNGKQIILADSQHHHLINVLRFKPQQQTLSLFNEIDGEWHGIVTFNKKHSSFTPQQKIRAGLVAPALHPILYFAPIRAGRIELLLEKSVELGVAQLCPIRTEYTQFQLPKIDRINRILQEAAQQSDRLSVPILLPEISLKELCASYSPSSSIVSPAVLLFFREQGEAIPAPLWFADHATESPQEPNQDVSLLIGPEGGFSPQEMEMLSSTAGVTPVSLGARILRSETAAMVALTLWQAYCGDFGKQR